MATAVYFAWLAGPPELGAGGALGGLLGAADTATLAGVPLPVVAFAALIVSGLRQSSYAC